MGPPPSPRNCRRHDGGRGATAAKPKRLAAGDTVALVSPASATFNSIDLQIAKESLEALGFKVRAGDHMMERHGNLAGADKARAEDINKAFADKSVHAVHAIRGGWGSARLLPYLGFDTIRRNPKGGSHTLTRCCFDHAKPGLVTSRTIGMGRWTPGARYPSACSSTPRRS